MFPCQQWLYKSHSGYWLLSQPFYNILFSINILHIIHKICIKHLEVLGIQSEHNFGNVPAKATEDKDIPKSLPASNILAPEGRCEQNSAMHSLSKEKLMAFLQISLSQVRKTDVRKKRLIV